MVQHCPVQYSLDLDGPGKRTGFVDVNLSDKAHAFCVISSAFKGICDKTLDGIEVANMIRMI